MKENRKDIKYIKRVNIYKREMPVWLQAIIKALFIFFMIICAAVVIFNFIHIGTPVIGESMVPTLNGYENPEIIDTVYINKYAGYTNGDIIVIQNPENNSNANKYVIKRLIAKGGDKIAIVRTDNGGVSASNGTYSIQLIKKGAKAPEIIKENYLEAGISLYYSYIEFHKLLNNRNFTGGEIVNINGITYLEIHNDYIFYMGDNRSSEASSKDCLEYGPIPKNKVVGKVDIIVYGSQNHFNQILNHYVNSIFG